MYLGPRHATPRAQKIKVKIPFISINQFIHLSPTNATRYANTPQVRSQEPPPLSIPITSQRYLHKKTATCCRGMMIRNTRMSSFFLDHFTHSCNRAVTFPVRADDPCTVCTPARLRDLKHECRDGAGRGDPPSFVRFVAKFMTPLRSSKLSQIESSYPHHPIHDVTKKNLPHLTTRQLTPPLLREAPSNAFPPRRII
jgi:hypothetical protein